MGNAKRTHMLTTSNGIKVGLVGLGEREWLETINTLPPNLIYKSASATARELVPQLREQGAELVICLSHMREPNDNKLAEQTDGLFDIILGGHDHYYSHSFVKGTHVLRSGTDFKQMSYIEARRKRDGSARWDFDIWRRDVTSEVAEDEETAKLVGALTSKLQKSLAKPIGWTATPLDARFSTVRARESNLGNFVCDVMRRHHDADCTIMASGTIRGDQVYPPGVVRIKDITTCFPFEDPVVCLRVKGQAIWDALENGVSTYPAQEGRFPQVSNIVFEFDPARQPGKRLNYLQIGGRPYDADGEYVLVTRGYMGRGKGEHYFRETHPQSRAVILTLTKRRIHKSARRVGRRQGPRNRRRGEWNPHLRHPAAVLYGAPHHRAVEAHFRPLGGRGRKGQCPPVPFPYARLREDAGSS
jgi:2',3'-cyclic-nucleotide 2'-phosphodiesterase (5'-nucleotidase family)